MRARTRGIVIAGAVLLLAPGAAELSYETGGGTGCASCHEIQRSYDQWSLSTHRNVSCRACHGDALTLDPAFHLNNLHRVAGHLEGRVSEPIRLRQPDLPDMLARCQKCHRQEFADWQAGPHASTYSRIFLDRKHNASHALQDDCLRCHGMHFEGGIRELVTPVDTRGPWRLWRPELASRPAIPCLTCHQMHREGPTLIRPAAKAVNASPAEEINRPSLALFDRRELEHISVQRLPLPKMREEARAVKISPDPRQTLCYQCHAPLSTFEVGSGDDRTPIGVHEGLSCLACHEKHGQKTRASCSNCHPQLSNCGLDVEIMDTTFRSTKSPHNIHFVKCTDCHTKGVPRRKKEARAARFGVRQLAAAFASGARSSRCRKQASCGGKRQQAAALQNALRQQPLPSEATGKP